MTANRRDEQDDFKSWDVSSDSLLTREMFASAISTMKQQMGNVDRVSVSVRVAEPPGLARNRRARERWVRMTGPERQRHGVRHAWAGAVDLAFLRNPRERMNIHVARVTRRAP